MSVMNDHHHKAMDQAARGLYERMEGNEQDAARFFAVALDFELQALDELTDTIEPTHSVLHRSAATLALDCGEIRLAERLAARALAEEPPADIADELREVLKQANFLWRLRQTEVELGDDGMQLSAVGQHVGLGVVLWEDFNERVGDTFKLLHRIIARNLNLPFRERGPLPRSITRSYPQLLSAPRSGSFVVTLKLGQPTQRHLPGMSTASEYFDEFLDLMEMVNSSDIDSIHKRIPDKAYVNNFLGLAKKIAPDGDRVSQVRFTVQRAGANRHVSVTRSKSQLTDLKIPEPPEPEAKPDEISGILRFADVTRDNKNKIKIIDEKDKSHEIEVPEGLMNDIVRPMWGLDVVVKGIRIGSRFELQEIEPQ